MTIALDENNKRVLSAGNQKGFCQVCHEPLIPHCGEIYVHHWQHRYDRDCDPWKEHETEWHRAWKNKFPVDWRERILENDLGERHIADIKTDKGIIIEFQNSSISTTTIREREEFYEDMIWVVNAAAFKDNFRKFSIVQQELRDIDRDFSSRLVKFKHQLELEIKQLSDQIESHSRQTTTKVQEIKNLNDRLEDFQTFQRDIAATCKRVTSYWFNNGLFDNQIRKLEQKIDASCKKEITDCQSEKDGQKKVILKHENDLTYIQEKNDVIFQGKKLKGVQYREIKPAYYQQILVLKKDSLHSLFVEGSYVKSELEFNNLQYRLHEVLLAIDPTESVSKMTDLIEQDKIRFTSLEATYEEMISRLTENIIVAIKSSIEELEKEIDEKETAFAAHAKLETDLNYQLYILEDSKQVKLNNEEHEAKVEKEQDRKTVMYARKGAFQVEWKHERTTWKVADMPIYFDLADGFLYRRIHKNEFQRMTYEEFIRYYGVRQPQLNH